MIIGMLRLKGHEVNRKCRHSDFEKSNVKILWFTSSKILYAFGVDYQLQLGPIKKSFKSFINYLLGRTYKLKVCFMDTDYLSKDKESIEVNFHFENLYKTKTCQVYIKNLSKPYVQSIIDDLKLNNLNVYYGLKVLKEYE